MGSRNSRGRLFLIWPTRDMVMKPEIIELILEVVIRLITLGRKKRKVLKNPPETDGFETVERTGLTKTNSDDI